MHLCYFQRKEEAKSIKCILKRIIDQYLNSLVSIYNFDKLIYWLFKGEMWNSLEEEKKQKYQKQAADLKEKHYKDHPEWKWSNKTGGKK